MVGTQEYCPCEMRQKYSDIPNPTMAKKPAKNNSVVGIGITKERKVVSLVNF
jgi:hypothetical protein